MPISPYRDARLPLRTADIVDEWNRAGEIFDCYYVAGEPRTTSLPTLSLIGAISPDGRSAHWFVLDRWASSQPLLAPAPPRRQTEHVEGRLP